jgi:hypothetical protein
VATPPSLVTVNVVSALVVPHANVPHAWLVGATLIAAGARPVPVTEVVPDVAPVALAVMVAGPSAAGVDGVKMTPNVHVWPAPSPALQLLVTAKSAALPPAIAICGALDGTPPAFWTVKVCVLLGVPTVSEPKSCDAGVTVSAAGAAPVPDSATLASSPAGSLAASVAVRDPVAVGANWTSTVHVAEGASGLPEQPSFDVANCAASGPARAIVTLPVALPPPFDSVNVVGVATPPVTTVPNGTLITENDRAPALSPVPASAMLTVPPGVASIASVAVAAPAVVGAKWTVTPHVPPEGSDWPVQPSVSITNAAALGPVMAVASGPDVDCPVLLMVNVEAALFDPRGTLPNAPVAELPLSTAKLVGVPESSPPPPELLELLKHPLSASESPSPSPAIQRPVVLAVLMTPSSSFPVFPVFPVRLRAREACGPYQGMRGAPWLPCHLPG